MSKINKFFHNLESSCYLETYIVPFLSMDLFKLVKSLMERFVKSALLKDVTCASKLTSIDIRNFVQKFQRAKATANYRMHDLKLSLLTIGVTLNHAFNAHFFSVCLCCR